jgi:hypothetical protein
MDKMDGIDIGNDAPAWSSLLITTRTVLAQKFLLINMECPPVNLIYVMFDLEHEM